MGPFVLTAGQGTPYWPEPPHTRDTKELRKLGMKWPNELLIEQEIRERYAPLFHHVSITRKRRPDRPGFVVRLWLPHLSAPVKLHLFSRKKKTVLESLDNQVSRLCHYHEVASKE
jgi:hypothetical protein